MKTQTAAYKIGTLLQSCWIWEMLLVVCRQVDQCPYALGETSQSEALIRCGGDKGEERGGGWNHITSLMLLITPGANRTGLHTHAHTHTHTHTQTPHVEHSRHTLITHSGCSDMPTVAMMQEQLVRQQHLRGQPWQSEQHSEPETQTGGLHWLHWDFNQTTLGLTGWGREEESENLAYIYTWPWVTV